MDGDPILPQLRSIYPADVGRLLRWVFWRPAMVTRYKAQYGDDSLENIGSWLAMLLLWAPLLIPAMGYFFGQVPLTSTVATILVVALPLSVWFIVTRNDLIGAGLGAMFFLIHTIDKSAADGNTMVAFTANIALAVAFLPALVVAIVTTHPLLPMAGFLPLTFGVGTWVALHVGGEGFVLGFGVGVVVALLWAVVVITITLALRKQERYRLHVGLATAILGLAVLAEAVLVWVYLLDGWSNLS